MSDQLKRFELAVAENGWLTKNGTIIPFNELTDEQLVKFHKQAVRKELHFYNLSQAFSVRRDYIEAEAEKRNVVLKEPEQAYFNNKRELKARVS